MVIYSLKERGKEYTEEKIRAISTATEMYKDPGCSVAPPPVRNCKNVEGVYVCMCVCVRAYAREFESDLYRPTLTSIHL